MSSYYDKKDIFLNEIQPYLDKIHKICSDNEIPFFFSACVENTDTTSNYIRDCVSSGACDLELTNDEINRHIMVSRGFKLRDSVYDEQEEMELMAAFYDEDYD